MKKKAEKPEEEALPKIGPEKPTGTRFGQPDSEKPKKNEAKAGAEDVDAPDR